MVLLNFAKFQPGDAYERVVYKKKACIIFDSCNISTSIYIWIDVSSRMHWQTLW